MCSKASYSFLGKLLPVAGLFCLILYGAHNQPELTLTQALSNPEFHEGDSLFVGTEAVITRIEAEGFYISYMDQQFWVLGQHPDLQVGEFIQMNVIFHQQGGLELIACYVPDNRRLKIWYSILPLPVLLLLFFIHWRLQKSGLLPRGNSHA
jgi:hypothetical protein